MIEGEGARELSEPELLFLRQEVGLVRCIVGTGGKSERRGDGRGVDPAELAGDEEVDVSDAGVRNVVGETEVVVVPLVEKRYEHADVPLATQVAAHLRRDDVVVRVVQPDDRLEQAAGRVAADPLHPHARAAGSAGAASTDRFPARQQRTELLHAQRDRRREWRVVLARSTLLRFDRIQAPRDFSRRDAHGPAGVERERPENAGDGPRSVVSAPLSGFHDPLRPKDFSRDQLRGTSSGHSFDRWLRTRRRGDPSIFFSSRRSASACGGRPG